MIARFLAHRRLLRTRWVAVAVATSAFALPLQPQRILGLGEDAVTIPRGTLRVGLGADLTLQRNQWVEGRFEPLGAAFSGSALGPGQLHWLGPLQQVVRDLGAPDFAASLGATELALRQRIFVTPLSIDYGVTEWFTIGVRAPLVRSRAESAFRLRGEGGRATLGPNPYFLGSAVPAANRATIDAFSNAATGLNQRAAACQGNPAAAPECPTILAELPAVGALVSATSLFANNLTLVYGASGLTGGGRYVPMAGSPTELALLARVDSLRTAFTRYGIADITPSTGLPLGAQSPLGATDVAALFTDSTYGYGARPLDGTALTELGDVEIVTKFRLFDSFGGASGTRFGANRFGVRQSLGLDVRLGTGTPERPDDFLDLGTGTGTTALTVRSLTDVVWNRALWATISVGYTREGDRVERLRVPSTPGEVLLEAWREADVAVRPGALLDLSVTPRWQVGDYLALGAGWRWRSRAGAAHTVDQAVVGPSMLPVPLDGSALDATSASSVQHFAWHATFSTLAARQRGLRGLAFEVSFSHEQAFASSEGIVPRTWLDRLQVRYYTRLFGR